MVFSCIAVTLFSCSGLSCRADFNLSEARAPVWFLWDCGSAACEPYLGVEWRWQISELCDVCEQRSWIVSLPVRPITALQTVPPLSLWYFQIAVARWCCSKTVECERSSRAVCTWKRQNVHVCVCSTYPRVCPAGPASSGCCSCCWCWRCGCCRRGGVWSLSPGATTETSSTHRGRPRTPADTPKDQQNVLANMSVWTEACSTCLRRGNSAPEATKCFHIRANYSQRPRTSCQPFKQDARTLQEQSSNISDLISNNYYISFTLSSKQLLLNTVLMCSHWF